ncbi:hypothetical protein [Hellea balneolensis]|uniref:hypothetical protein n=1 Tax=Hellea balneolensis TaxID=287478 RepID=UPI000421276D|nr:hypothetical protein [Hellea balneolensis]
MKQISIFARSLKKLLDDTNYFSRNQWADFLTISTPAISQWVNDKTLPRADLVLMIVDVLKQNPDKNTIAVIEEFESLYGLPCEDISPFGSRMGKTLSEYLADGSFFRFGRELRGLTPEQQVSLIEKGGFASVDTAAPELVDTDPTTETDAFNENRSTLAQKYHHVLSVNIGRLREDIVSEFFEFRPSDFQYVNLDTKELSTPIYRKFELRESLANYLFNHSVPTSQIKPANKALPTPHIETANEALEVIGMPPIGLRSKLMKRGSRIQANSSRAVEVMPAIRRLDA